MSCTDWTDQLTDHANPTTARIEAARKAAKECRDYAAWQLLCSIVVAEDEDPALRCAVVHALPDWNRYAAVNFLARTFQDKQVRAAALETLETMGAVEGEMETRLLADLSALRRGDADVYIANLPLMYGRDPRVLEYLLELYHEGDEGGRAQAVGALCCLGEAARVLDMVDDASPKVRAALSTALGWYGVDAGIDVLKRQLGDGDAEVSKEAKKALRLLGVVEMAKPRPRATNESAESAWTQLLRDISRIRLADAKVAVDVPDHMVEAGWLGEPGAPEKEIEAAERRLGVRLPPSYRKFLAESNGFQKLSPFIWRLFGVAEIDWFRTRHADWIEAYQITDDISPEEHRQQPLDSPLWRAAYLRSCLQISDEGDSAVVLLNPEVVTPEGEWETWFFANWIPGIYRYRSFRDYVDEELRRATEFSKRA